MIDYEVAIIGLGLMGGSLALALKGKVKRLVGIDTHAGTRQMALAQHTVDAVAGDLAVGIQTADLIIFATPVRTILKLLPQLPKVRPDGCMVLDLGSTKGDICEAMETLPASFEAVGGHPMCGKETAGFMAAVPDLYAGQTFIMCENGRSTPRALSLCQEIIQAIGAVPLTLSSTEHDHIVALTSHLPYLLSAMLMAQASKTAINNKHVWPVSATGLKDTTRLAGSDPVMMLDILRTNKTAVLTQLTQYQALLEEIKILLETNDETTLAHWLQAKQVARHAYLKQKFTPPD